MASESLKKFFLPHVFQKAGLVIATAGAFLTYLRFGAGIKPGFLDTRVFAFYSTYFDTKYFRFIDNNISEEICGMTIIAGLFLVAFSREKYEKDHYWVLRLKSFILASYGSLLFLLLTLAFVFGIAFFNILSVYIILPLLLYALIFRYFLVKERYSSLNS